MAGMTRIARRRPELRPVLAQVSNLGGGLQADFVASPAAFFDNWGWKSCCIRSAGCRIHADRNGFCGDLCAGESGR